MLVTEFNPSKTVLRNVVGVRSLPCPYAMAQIPTPWGVCGIAWKNRENEPATPFSGPSSEALLCRIWTPGLSAADLRAEIGARYPGCREVLCGKHGDFHPEIVPEWFGALTRYLQSYYAAGLRDWSEPRFLDNWAFWKSRLDWSQVTPFQRGVLEVVAQIPSGMTLTYREVATRVGKPAASRAIGGAVGANPWPVLIPCHRVMGAGGRLTGFSAPGGIAAKRRMLEMEGV